MPPGKLYGVLRGSVRWPDYDPEMYGILSLVMYGRSASVSGVPYPSTRRTLSSSTNFLYAATARGGWKPYSTLTSSSFLPLTPPFSLMYVTASIRPWAISLPWSEVGPVRSTRLPILMVCASAGTAPRPMASRTSVTDRTSEDVILRMTASLSVRFGSVRFGSVRIGPQLPVAPEPLPDPREPHWLVHQEEDDGQAEHDVARRGDQSERVRIDPRQRRRAQLEHLGQQGHEHGAVDGADDAAHAADDDHSQVVDRHQQREGVGKHDARVIGHQAPGHARVERADHERQQLVTIEADADDRGRYVAITHRDERAANPGAKQVLGEQHRGDDEGIDQVEHTLVRVERAAEHRGRCHVEAEHAVGHRLPVDDPVRGDEVRRQRGDGQVEPLQAQTRDPEHQPEQRGQHPGQRQRQPERQPGLGS